jgi:hypothetical protein
MGFGKVRSVARFDRLNNELTSLREQGNLSSMQQRRVEFLENRVPQVRAELQVELDELQNQRAAAVSSSKQETMDPKFWEAREKASRGVMGFDAADVMPPAEQKFAREIKALEDKLGITEEFANMAPVVDKVDTVIAGDGKNIQAAQEAGALTFTREEERAVAEDAKRAGVTTPQDIPKLPVRQRHALIAVLTSRYVGKGEKEKEIYSALMNYATTGDPTLSGKDAATAANSRRTANTAAQSRLDDYGVKLREAHRDYVVSGYEAVVDDDGGIRPWDDLDGPGRRKLLGNISEVETLAVNAKGSTTGNAADAVLIPAMVLPMLSYAKTTDNAGFIDDLADIARDEAVTPTGSLANLITFEYDKRGNPKVINFGNPAGGVYEASLSFTDAKKLLGPAALGKLRRLDAAIKAQSQPQEG